MGRTKKTGVSGSFGSRYGTKARKRYRQIVEDTRRLHECPSCNYKRVQRESFGIWICKRCGYKFAGGAYTPVTKLGILASRAAAKKIEEVST